MKQKMAAMIAMITVMGMSGSICQAETLVNETEQIEATAWEESIDAVGTGESITVQAAAGSDISGAVNEALQTAAINGAANAVSTVIIPAGSYTISKPLYIGSNTTLKAEGATITYSGSDKCNLIVTGKTDRNISVECAGYNGYSNITIIGGTFISNKKNTASMIKMAHATNVKISGVTLSGGGCAHQMEVCAIDGFTVDGCVFKDMEAVYDGVDKQEALQLDIPCSEDVFLNAYQDGTVMKNVTIKNCTFSNVPRGLGSHTALLGAYHENIVIADNTFSNITEEAIIGLNYYNCSITGNKMTNCGAGVLFQYFKANPGSSIYSSVPDGQYVNQIRNDAKTVISDNTITSVYNKDCDEVQGIKVYGNKLTKAVKGADKKTILAGDYYVSGVAVSNNTITTAGHGIHLSDAKSCTITGNVINGKGFSSKDSNRKKYDGIFFNSGSTDNTIENNTISAMPRNGIFGMDNSTAASIAKNQIVSCQGYGIGLYNKCKMTGDISENTISNVGNAGISISTKSTVGGMSLNTISKTKGTGINIYLKCTAKGAIRGNVISNTKKHNITVSTGSKAGSITGNTLKSAGDNAILIYNKSTVKKINKNKITGAKGRAIFVYSLKNSLSISNNTISKGKNAGIVLEPGTAKYKITVKGNKISVLKNNYAVYGINGKVSVTNNTYNKKSLGIKLNSAVKGKATKNKRK